MKRKTADFILLLLVLVLAVGYIGTILRNQTAVRTVINVEEETMQFRSMQMSEQTLGRLYDLKKETAMTIGQLLTVLYPDTEGNFLHISSRITAGDCVRRKQQLIKGARSSFEQLCSSYGAVWDDIVCMPVPADGIVYENSWMFERNYGGKRGHEGTDLIPPENLPGHYRIVSMTDGVVEQIGWLPQGGYRIGIRSLSGGYFYYAHLDSYARSFKPGDTVEAGELLGMMGDTGYGTEGTKGKFDVHLHLGIYIRTERSEELSVNPYWVLRYLELETAKTE